VTLQPIRRFGLDAAILFSDILILPWALGQDLRFAEGEGPLLGPLDVGALSQAGAPARWAPVIETVRRVVDGLPPGVPLIGFAGSPLTVAAYMIDGRGGDYSKTRAMIASADPMLDRVLAALVEGSVTYLSAQIEAGASTVQLFESHGALADATTLERLVLAPTRAIVHALRQRHLAAYAAGTGVDCVGIDTDTSLSLADRVLPAGIAIQGNLDPKLLVAGGLGLAEAARFAVKEAGARPLVFNLGHGITPDTPPDNNAALVAAVRGAT
jgi:uroporphyrinogen decarboxylase